MMKALTQVGAFLVAIAAALTTSGSTAYWAGTAGDNSWYNPLNWFDRRVPGPADDILLGRPGSMVEITNSLTVRALSINGMALIVRGKGAYFSATGDTLIVNGHLSALDGGVIDLPKLYTYTTGAGSVAHTLKAEGAGSVLKFPNLKNIASPSSVVVSARSGGLVDFPKLTGTVSGTFFKVQGVSSSTGLPSRVDAPLVQRVFGRWPNFEIVVPVFIEVTEGGLLRLGTDVPQTEIQNAPIKLSSKSRLETKKLNCRGLASIAGDGTIVGDFATGNEPIGEYPDDQSINPNGVGPSYQWFKNNEPVVNATNSTLTFASVTTNDAAIYSVRVSNLVGVVVSAPVALSVTAPRNTGFAQRDLPAGYVPGSVITVQIVTKPPSATLVYAVEDRPPVGWMASSMSDNGVFDPASERVKFGPFFDATARTLIYQLVVPLCATGKVTLAGIASRDQAESSLSIIEPIVAPSVFALPGTAAANEGGRAVFFEAFEASRGFEAGSGCANLSLMLA